MKLSSTRRPARRSDVASRVPGAFLAMGRGAAVATGVTLLLVGGFTAVVAPAALPSAVLGVVLATAFFAFGSLALMSVINRPGVHLVVAALSIYVVQVVALFALYGVLASATRLDGRWLAGAALVHCVAWQAGLALGLRRTRQLLYPHVALPAPATS